MGRPRKRANGDGSTYCVPGRRKPWAASVVVAWSPEGRPIRRARYASSEREAKALLAEMVAARETSRPLPDDRLTVGNWLNLWLRRQGERDDLRANTVAAYDRAVRLLLPELGMVPLRRLRSPSVESALADLRRRYTAHTVAGARSVLSTSLKDAERAGHILTNPAALARGPKVRRTGLPAPDTATVRAILAELSTHRLHALYVLLAGTGLRIGEATGLRWEDIDDGDGVGGLAGSPREGRQRSVAAAGAEATAAGMVGLRSGGGRTPDGRSGGGPAHLTVIYQLQRIGGEHVLTDPKTDTAGRVVFLPPSVSEALRQHRVRQAAERLQAGRNWRQADLVFTTAEGQPVAESTAHWTLARACERAGVRHVSPHDLRRFYLTVVQDAVGMEAAQLVAGHVNPRQTATYVTVRDGLLARAAEAAQEAIGG